MPSVRSEVQTLPVWTMHHVWAERDLLQLRFILLHWFTDDNIYVQRQSAFLINSERFMQNP